MCTKPFAMSYKQYNWSGLIRTCGCLFKKCNHVYWLLCKMWNMFCLFTEFGAGEGWWHVRYHHQTRPLRRNEQWDVVCLRMAAVLLIHLFYPLLYIMWCFSVTCSHLDLVFFLFHFLANTVWNKELFKGQICLYSFSSVCLFLYSVLSTLLLCVDYLTARPPHK